MTNVGRSMTHALRFVRIRGRLELSPVLDTVGVRWTSACPLVNEQPTRITGFAGLNLVLQILKSWCACRSEVRGLFNFLQN